MGKNKLVFESLEEFQNTGYEKWLKEFQRIAEEEYGFADVWAEFIIEISEKELFNLYDIEINPKEAAELLDIENWWTNDKNMRPLPEA